MKARNIKIREHIANRLERRNMKFELGVTPSRRAFGNNLSA